MTPHLTVRTEHADPERIASAIRPDNTEEMTTSVDDGRVVTSIERPDVGSLRATADDYLRSLAAADAAASPRIEDVGPADSAVVDTKEGP